MIHTFTFEGKRYEANIEDAHTSLVLPDGRRLWCGWTETNPPKWRVDSVIETLPMAKEV